MKKLLLILLMTSPSLFAGALVVNNNQVDGLGQGIYEYSDDGSEYTKIADIDFDYSENVTIIDHANGKVYLRRETDAIEYPDNSGNFVTYQYYVMFDKATGEFTGEYGDDLFTAFETVEYDTAIEGLEDGLVNSGISATAATASANSTAVSVNSTAIANNTTNIATNTAGIATNTTNIATNTAGIAANTTGIANNVVRLDNLGALAASNANRVEGLETLTGLMQNEYRSGIASSIALSQIQYAASGFSIGVGHGEFKNKDEMAVGIGYGGQFNEDVGFQFQFGSSGDSTGFGFTISF
jgi:antirestriction protein ArdC